MKIPEMIKNMSADIPENVRKCMDPEANQDIADFLNAFGNPQTDPNIAKKLIGYVTLHYAHVHQSLITANNDWTSANFK
jgi:predicted DNA binding CopG/RHH family protein